MATATVARGPLGWYVHHHGTGHLRRALLIAAHVQRPVVMFCSLPQPEELPPNVSYIRLINDAVSGFVQPAGSVFHYTPYDAAIFERNAQLLRAWREYGIRDIYVDVSVEVVVLAKLFGLRAGMALMQGNRTDQAHTHGYAVADYILAHCAEQLVDSASFHTTTPAYYSGGISRYLKRPLTPLTAARRTTDGMPATITVTVSPAHEQDLSRGIVDAATCFPDTTWHVIGQEINHELPNLISHGSIADPSALYEASDLIIGSGGMNTICEIASFGKPFVCIPEPRPFDEQQALASKLQQRNMAVCRPRFPTKSEWPEIIRRLENVDLDAFSSLIHDDAALRAARIIDSSSLS